MNVAAVCIAIVVLGILTVMYVIAQRRTHSARLHIAKEVGVIARIVRVLALHHTTDADVRADVIASLQSSDVLCADCPLHKSSLCQECGRYASGEGRKQP